MLPTREPFGRSGWKCKCRQLPGQTTKTMPDFCQLKSVFMSLPHRPTCGRVSGRYYHLSMGIRGESEPGSALRPNNLQNSWQTTHSPRKATHFWTMWGKMVEWKRQPVTAPDAKKNIIKNIKNCGNGPGLRGTNTFRLASFCFQTETRPKKRKNKHIRLERKMANSELASKKQCQLKLTKEKWIWKELNANILPSICLFSESLNCWENSPHFPARFHLNLSSKLAQLFIFLLFFSSSWLAKQKIFARYVKFMFLALLGHTIWHYFYCGFIFQIEWKYSRRP